MGNVSKKNSGVTGHETVLMAVMRATPVVSSPLSLVEMRLYCKKSW